MPNIRFENVNIYYGKKHKRIAVVNDFNTCFFDQGINVILGDSGSGKTTILKALVDICEYDGNIYFDDKNIFDIPVNKRNINYVSQSINLFPHMTVFENIAFPLKIRKVDHDEMLRRVREISSQLEIEHCLNYRGRYLSIGQQQRAMIARELISNPSVLLMDEPFSNLQDELKVEFLSLVKKLAKERRLTIVYVTHSYKEALKIADHIFILEDGKIVDSGTPKKLIDENNQYLENMLKAETVNAGIFDEEKKDR